MAKYQRSGNMGNTRSTMRYTSSGLVPSPVVARPTGAKLGSIKLRSMKPRITNILIEDSDELRGARNTALLTVSIEAQKLPQLNAILKGIKRMLANGEF